MMEGLTSTKTKRVWTSLYPFTDDDDDDGGGGGDDDDIDLFHVLLAL
jgi:hypothetical protein